jgi:transposase InsO family protein
MLLEQVLARRREHRRIGGRKLYHMLQPDLLKMNDRLGRDKFFDVLREQGLLITRKRRYAQTTQSRHRFYVYRNELKAAVIENAHQAWVSDITYVRTLSGFMYLFLITDVGSRKIVGWHLSNSLAVEGAMKALSGAIKQCPPGKKIIHHSDRGLQYCAPTYTSKLLKHGFTISMGDAGNCYDNAIAERVNGILKQEYGLDGTFTGEADANRAATTGIKSYNYTRPHLSLGLKTPEQVHQKGSLVL